MTALELGCRLLLGVVFLASVWGKLADLPAFAGSLRALRVLPAPARTARPVAVTVVVLEAAVPLLLAVPLVTAGVAGFGVAFCLLATFSVAILVSRRRGARAPCRCFGHAAAALGPRHVVRNVLLAGAALLGAATAAGLVGAGGNAAAHHPGALLVGALSGLVVAVLAVMSDDLVELFATR